MNITYTFITSFNPSLTAIVALAVLFAPAFSDVDNFNDTAKPKRPKPPMGNTCLHAGDKIKTIKTPISCLALNYPKIWSQIAGQFYSPSSTSKLWTCDGSEDQEKMRPIPLQINLSKNTLTSSPMDLQKHPLELLMRSTNATKNEIDKAVQCNDHPDLSISDQLVRFKVKVKLLRGSEQKTFGPKTASEEWVVARNAQPTAS